MTTTWRVLAVPAIAGLLFAGACSSSAASETRLALVGHGNDPNLGASIPGWKRNIPIVMPMPPLCTTGGRITITSVRADEPTGGLRVVDWGTFRRVPSQDPSQDIAGAVEGRVSDYRGFGHHAVAERCDQTRSFDDFAISAATTTARGTMRGLVVTYQAGGRTRVMRVTYGLTLCTSENCPDEGWRPRA